MLSTECGARSAKQQTLNADGWNLRCPGALRRARSRGRYMFPWVIVGVSAVTHAMQDVTVERSMSPLKRQNLAQEDT
jgi:hypothetical protein